MRRILIEASVQQKNILWIDDEEFILSTVRRLFRNTDFNVTLESDPRKALELISQNDYLVIVSDQRMPHISGIELLSKAKELRPLSSRLMVTAFIDDFLLLESVNRSGVFRFINKPWEDHQLLNDIRLASDHALQLRQMHELKKQVSGQNQSLSALNINLEQLVEERTKNLEESRNALRLQENKIRDTIRFIQKLNDAESLDEVLTHLRQELKTYRDLGDPMLMISSADFPSVFYSSQSGFVSKKEVKVPVMNFPHLRINDTQDQKLIANMAGRPISHLIAIPLQRRSEDEGMQKTTIFIEYYKELQDLKSLSEELSEKLQPVAIAIDRVTATERMGRVARQWEKTFDAIEEPVAILNADYQILRANRHFREKKTSKVCHESFNKSPVICEGCPMTQAFETRKPADGVVTRNGRVYEVHSYPLVLNDSQITTFIHHYSDITESRNLYSQLLQSEKMAALGELAGNIAHELNNPLTGIRSLVQLITAKMDNDGIKSDLRDIHDAAVRSQVIIKNLQDFSSHQGDQKKELVSINEVIEKTMPLLKTLTREHEKFVEYDDQNPKVFANAHLLQQVVFNLVTNAAHAMSEGGKLEIRVFHEQDRVGFSIKDNGAGIPEHLQKKIFEPFFTTKKEGKGTGLGLSVCKSIVQDCGGTITLVSHQGLGSEFTVQFPQEVHA